LRGQTKTKRYFIERADSDTKSDPSLTQQLELLEAAPTSQILEREISDDVSPSTTAPSVHEDDAAVASKKDEQARLESRKKLSQLYKKALESSGNNTLRRPRWRIEQDVMDGVVTNFSGPDGANNEQAMPLQQVFRSVTIAVKAAQELQRLRLKTKMSQKEQAVKVHCA
jgi:hypothetical protein